MMEKMREIKNMIANNLVVNNTASITNFGQAQEDISRMHNPKELLQHSTEMMQIIEQKDQFMQQANLQ